MPQCARQAPLQLRVGMRLRGWRVWGALERTVQVLGAFLAGAAGDLLSCWCCTTGSGSPNS